MKWGAKGFNYSERVNQLCSVMQYGMKSVVVHIFMLFHTIINAWFTFSINTDTHHAASTPLFHLSEFPLRLQWGPHTIDNDLFSVRPMPHLMFQSLIKIHLSFLLQKFIHQSIILSILKCERKKKVLQLNF